MSSVERRFFSAQSLERAVLEAAGHFGVAPDRLRYEPVDKRSGFTKRRRVVIRVDPARLLLEPGERTPALPPEVPRLAAEPPALEVAAVAAAEEPEPVPEPPPIAVAPPVESAPLPRFEPVEHRGVVAPRAEERPIGAQAETTASPTPAASPTWQALPRTTEESLARRPRATSEVEASAKRWLALLLGLADLDLDATIRTGVDGLDVGLAGADAEWLVEDDGEALQALQTLLPRLIDGEAEDAAVCRVDCNGFQELREERLRVRAHRAAADVRQTGERAILEPMMPSDRRIVHLALQNDSSVATESVGRGFFKRVTIRPS
jgi:spoIIIJ-associated protein